MTFPTSLNIRIIVTCPEGWRERCKNVENKRRIKIIKMKSKELILLFI